MCFQLGPFSSRFEPGVSEARETDRSHGAPAAPESIRWRGGEVERHGVLGATRFAQLAFAAGAPGWGSVVVEPGMMAQQLGLQLGLPCGTPSLLKAPYRATLPAPVSCASGFSRWTWAGRGWGPLCHSRPFSPIPSYALFQELSGKKKKKSLGQDDMILVLSICV